MTTSTRLSLIALVSLSGLVGCAVTDNVVGSRPLNAAGMAGAGEPDAIGGATQGGGTGNPTTVLGGTAGHSPDHAGGTAGTVPNATGGGAGYRVGCEDYVDATSGHAVDILIKNERSTPVYVGNRATDCSNDQTFRIYDAVGTAVAVDDDPATSCTCQDFMTHGSSGCWVRSCLRSPLRRIEPNASLTLKWDGLYLVSREFRAACAVEGETSVGCQQTKAAPSGQYTAVITGSTAYECPFSTDMFDCTCVETNSCQLGMIPIQGAGELLEPSVEFDLMSTSIVTVVFTDTMSSS